jgi:hypothetical protein
MRQCQMNIIIRPAHFRFTIYIYLRTTLTIRNLIKEEIEKRLNTANACYHSVQNLLSSRPLSKNVKIRIYEIIILPVVLYECEILSLTLRENID